MACATPRRGSRGRGIFGAALPGTCRVSAWQSLDGYQEFPARRMPGAGVVGDAATTDQTGSTCGCRLGTRVQVCSTASTATVHTNVTRIAGEFDDRSGAGLHQHAVAVALIGPQRTARSSAGTVMVMWKYGTGSSSA